MAIAATSVLRRMIAAMREIEWRIGNVLSFSVDGLSPIGAQIESRRRVGRAAVIDDACGCDCGACANIAVSEAAVARPAAANKIPCPGRRTSPIYADWCRLSIRVRVTQVGSYASLSWWRIGSQGESGSVIFHRGGS